MSQDIAPLGTALQTKCCTFRLKSDKAMTAFEIRARGSATVMLTHFGKLLYSYLSERTLGSRGRRSGLGRHGGLSYALVRHLVSSGRFWQATQELEFCLNGCGGDSYFGDDVRQRACIAVLICIHKFSGRLHLSSCCVCSFQGGSLP